MLYQKSPKVPRICPICGHELHTGEGSHNHSSYCENDKCPVIKVHYSLDNCAHRVISDIKFDSTFPKINLGFPIIEMKAP